MWNKIQRIYIGTNLVRPTWKPNANTLLYLPLESDVVDKSGKSWRTFTTSWISYTTVGGVPSVHIGNSWGISLTAPNPIVTTASTQQTISFLVYFSDGVISSRRGVLWFTKQNNMDVQFSVLENTSKLNLYGASSWATQVQILEQWVRKHIVCVNSSAWAYVYVNGVLISTATWSSTPRWVYGSSYEQSQTIWNVRDGLSASQWLRGNMRELIFEDRTWTAQDVANYYIWIKGKLWI